MSPPRPRRGSSQFCAVTRARHTIRPNRPGASGEASRGASFLRHEAVLRENSSAFRELTFCASAEDRGIMISWLLLVLRTLSGVTRFRVSLSADNAILRQQLAVLHLELRLGFEEDAARLGGEGREVSGGGTRGRICILGLDPRVESSPKVCRLVCRLGRLLGRLSTADSGIPEGKYGRSCALPRVCTVSCRDLATLGVA